MVDDILNPGEFLNVRDSGTFMTYRSVTYKVALAVQGTIKDLNDGDVMMAMV